MPDPQPIPARAGARQRLHEVLFEADTRAGKGFDLVLLLCIVVSIVAVCLESVSSIRAKHGELLHSVEWAITLLFSVEYVARLISIQRPLRYAFSFYGFVDLLSILPTWLSLFTTGGHSLLVIRALRLLRVFRVLKLAQFVGEASQLHAALAASARKIAVFLFTVLTVVLIVGAAMYLIEGEASGFTSIPQSMYWAIVTMTTVGYGDVAPETPLGKLLASFVMILGYGILAVPTGIVTVELASSAHKQLVSTQSCPSCSAEGHDVNARHCKFCGARL